MTILDRVRGPGPFVAFVGAGASAIPPSSLPTWRRFNTLLLGRLCERLAEYSGGRQPVAQMLARFRARRNRTGFLAPDLQAQLMEEEIGADYFRVWQSLDTDAFGPVHAGLAELAVRGKLAAVVTTNFDCLLETALAARSQPCDVFHDDEGFAALSARLEQDAPALPIVKLHGSIRDASSLVDTLRQRLAGRPAALLAALRTLLRRWPWVFLGSSGADFSYDRSYLGVLDAAPEAQGFVFVARPSGKVQGGVRALAQAYGPEKACVVEGDLRTWLGETFALGPVTGPAAAEEAGDATRIARRRIADWVGELGPMTAVNLLCALLRSAAAEADALWLLRRTWRSYRSPADTRGKAYPRYNLNYGLSLLSRGFIRNPVTLADDLGNALEWKEHADENAFELFARAHRDGHLAVAGAFLAVVLALRGEVGRAVSVGAAAAREVEKAPRGMLDRCDVAIASATLHDIIQVFRPTILQLRACVTAAQELGDEPRRAMLLAQLGRFLTYAGELGEAKAALDEADRIGGRLGLTETLLASRAARGALLADGGNAAAAVDLLGAVAARLRALEEEPLFTTHDLLDPNAAPRAVKGHHPARCRVLLDLNRAALLAGDAEVMNRSLDELDALAPEVFPGYAPHYYIAYAQCLLPHRTEEEEELIARLLAQARKVGALGQNPWVAQAVAHLERAAAPDAETGRQAGS